MKPCSTEKRPLLAKREFENRSKVIHSGKVIMKTGILGGTFDPIHYAHLLLAEEARETLGLDRVLFIPAGIPPHKRGRSITPGPERVEMVRLAVADVPGFEVSSFETESDEISYTVRTLRHLHQEAPDDSFVLIVGSETLADIPHWFEAEEVCRLASLAAAQRPGTPPADFDALAPFVSPDRLEEFRRQTIPMPLLEISSTDLRRRAAAGMSLRFLTPPPVVRFITERGLYLGDTAKRLTPP